MKSKIKAITHFTSTTGVCSLCKDTVTIKGPIISPWKNDGENEMY